MCSPAPRADSDAKPFLSKREVTRARVALIGFCVQCIVHILTIFVLGDDGEEAAWLGTEGALGSSTREPLVGQAAATTAL